MFTHAALRSAHRATLHHHNTRHGSLPPTPGAFPRVQPVGVTCKVDPAGATSLGIRILGFAAGRPCEQDTAGHPSGRVQPVWCPELHWLRYRFVNPANTIDTGAVQTLVQSELKKNAPYDGEKPQRLPFNAVEVIIRDIPGVYALDVNILPLAWLPLPTVQRAVGALWRPVIDGLFLSAGAWPSHYSREVTGSNSAMHMTLYCTKNDPPKK